MNISARAVRACLLATSAIAPVILASPVLAQTQPTEVEEIMVTATRQSAALSKVPVSVTAITQEKMDAQGVKTVNDIVRLTPGITLTPGRLSSNVAIRGISSTAGSGTVGVYIDDTPIQVRRLGTSASNAYPTVFDLERVEVLRGPQGTLFGAGSQGGTIRFIQPEPSLNTYSAYARSEIATTQDSAMSYEAGVAVGGPIVEDKLGFRVSAFYRRDGGWIDKVVGQFQVLDSTGRSGIGSLLFKPTGVYEKNSNWTETQSYRIALAWQATENLKFTPSIYYQHQYMHDNVFDIVPAASDFGNGRFVVPQNIPTVDSTHIALPNTYLNEPASEEIALPSIKTEWDLGFAQLTANSSFFYRHNKLQPDYTQLYQTTYARRQVPLPGDFAVSPAENRQQGGTQEIRLQGDLWGGRLDYVAGVFYSKMRQNAVQNTKANFISLVPSIANATVPGFPPPAPAVNNGAPFGPGYSAYENYYGVGLLDGVSTYFAHLTTTEEQIAGFGELHYNITDRLKLTLGGRYGKNDIELFADYLGPNSNLNTPRGYPCVPGTGSPGAAACVPVAIGQYKPGEGPFAPAYVKGTWTSSEKVFTPKIGLSFQADPGNLFYGTASKGFRPGGAQQRQPSTCNDQLASLGYLNAAGQPESPVIFNSDSVWSYEVGAKNRLFGGRLSLDTSLYYISWKAMQTNVSLNTCAQSFTDNLVDAVSKGFDFQASVVPIDGLTINAAVGYTDATYDEDVVLGGRRLFSKGSAINGNQPPWTVTLSGQYDFLLPGGIDSYVRGDYTWQSEGERTGATDPKSVSYDAFARVRVSTQQLNMRAGVRIDNADISLFVNNLTNEAPYLGLSRTINQPYWTSFTLRPRTIGITAAYRY